MSIRSLDCLDVSTMNREAASGISVNAAGGDPTQTADNGICLNMAGNRE